MRFHRLFAYTVFQDFGLVWTIYTAFRKTTATFVFCTYLRKSNQFEWKFQTKWPM